MVRSLYNLLFTIRFLPSAPGYAWRLWRQRQWRDGLGQRFGKYNTKLKQALTNRHVLWIHAGTEGGITLCTQLIRALEPRLPNMKMVVSTNTEASMSELQRLMPTHVSKIYYPIDRRQYVVRALSAIYPEAIVLTETEMRPNFIWRAHERGTPVFLVNARLAEEDYRRYKRFGALYRPLFATLAGVAAQDENEASRFRALGCLPERVQVVGRLQFEAAKLDERRLVDVPAMLGQLGVQPDDCILVAGNTHPGEEAVVAEAFLHLRARFPNLFLILVPRHFERSREVGRELQALGIKLIYRNEVMTHTQFHPGEMDCLVVNTTGELKYFYERATIIFVGRSFTPEGVHNPIEPGSAGKAMIFGPKAQKFAATARAFLERQAAVQVQDGAELEKVLGELLGDKVRRKQFGDNALKVVHEKLGAIDHSVEMILAQLDGGEFYVAPKKR